MDVGGTERTDGAIGSNPRLELLAGLPPVGAGPLPGRMLTRREWKVVGHPGDVGGLPVTTWRTVAHELAPIRSMRRRRRPFALRRRIWFGVAARCLLTFGTLP
jgi:hypothetical protein